MTWAGACDAITTALRGITSPRFQMVLDFEPLSIPADVTLAWWYTGDEEAGTTLGNAMINELVTVRAYWRLQTANELRSAQERECQLAVRAIKTALRANSNLDGHVTDLHIRDASGGFTKDINGMDFRVVSVPVVLVNLEAEAIVP